MRLVRTHHSVLTIVCTAPLSAILCLTATASKRVPFIGVIDIISIQVGPLLMVIQNNITFKVKALNFETLLFKTIDEVRNRYRASIIELLVYVGADINVQKMVDGERMTPLIRAASLHQTGSLDFVKLLIKLGADPNVRVNNMVGNGALIASTNYEITDYLLNHGADVNIRDNYGGTPLMCCSLVAGRADIAELLLQHGADVNIQNEDGTTALMFSCVEVFIDIVKLVLQYDADVNIRDNFGMTALMHSCHIKNADINIVKLLLERDADVDMQDKGGSTALIIAINGGHLDIAELLLQHGANPNIHDIGGDTALSYAIQRGYTKIAKLLIPKTLQEMEQHPTPTPHHMTATPQTTPSSDSTFSDEATAFKKAAIFAPVHEDYEYDNIL